MMMKKDDWIAAALMDDAVVVEMLFRLKDSYLSPPPPSDASLFLSLPPFHWGNRQPRSKPPKWSATARRSPTTPLSWSGGSGSPSDGVVSEIQESYMINYMHAPLTLTLGSWNKCTVTNEIFCNISSQRSKRKKTFAELKEEENSLLKERVHLERELASMHVTLNQQRARSDNLKKIKFDLNLESENEQPVYLESTKTRPSVLPRHNTTKDEPVSSDSCRPQNNRCFILPDLNMEPSEEEIGLLWD
nr:IQ domain-containing protein [Ipomoea batatas]